MKKEGSAWAEVVQERWAVGVCVCVGGVMVLNWPSSREEDLASPLPAESVSGVHTQSSLSE